MAQCRACDSPDLELLIDFGRMPLAGGFLDPSEVSGEQAYPLTIHVCRRCALVQIVEPIDPEILFHGYSFSASTIPGLVRHFDEYAQWLADGYTPRTVVEFGCNDGVLLGPLERRGVHAVGVDISDNISELARERGHHVITGAYTPDVAAAIRAEHGEADVVTGSNAFAHNADPEVILAAARESLRPGGVLALEVMYSGDLYEQTQWDTLYHEHLTFYGLSQLSVLLQRNGFTVTRAERIPMHGGSLRVVASTDPTVAAGPSVDTVLAYERDRGLDAADTWHAFADHSRRTIDITADVMGRLAKGAAIWGYGAAGKATMWVNACGMDYLAGMVDASPLRAGKLMPGTHTPIVLPEEFRAAEAPDFVFVTAWNYLDAIRANESWFRGALVTPLPALTFS